jgi:hypothetical protein
LEISCAKSFCSTYLSNFSSISGCDSSPFRLSISKRYAIFLINHLFIQPGDFSDSISVLSFVLSISCISVLFLMVIFIFWRVFKTPIDDLPKMTESNSFALVLFEKLKDRSRPALVFWGVFIIRRVIVSIIVVFMIDYQSLQLNLLVIQHFLMLGYVLIVKPFDDLIGNV